jgi:hypothetical protein
MSEDQDTIPVPREVLTVLVGSARAAAIVAGERGHDDDVVRRTWRAVKAGEYLLVERDIRDMSRQLEAAVPALNGGDR